MKLRYFWPAAFYFVFFSGLAIYSPYLALYFQSMGFSGSQTGLLLGLSPLVTLLASPFWTGLADLKHQHRLVLTITLLVSIIITVIIPFIRFYLVLVPVIILTAFFAAPHIPLADSATVSMLGENRDLYGKVRLWGTIGFGITALFAGLFLQRFGMRWVFWGFALILSMNILVTQHLTFTKSTSTTTYWRGVRQVLSDRKWVIFLLMVFIVALGGNVHNTYLSLLFEDLHASKGIFGVAQMLATLFELPVMFFAAPLLRKLKPKGLLLIAMAVTGLRCLVYAAASSHGILLAIQIVHGLTFPALMLAGVTYVAENTPPGLNATGQGLFSSAMMGFGAATANLLGGALIDWLGVAGMYGFIGILVLVSLAGFCLQDQIEIRKLAAQN
jgi:PPP family 3-phenylpropionic acid transporter